MSHIILLNDKSGIAKDSTLQEVAKETTLSSILGQLDLKLSELKTDDKVWRIEDTYDKTASTTSTSYTVLASLTPTIAGDFIHPFYIKASGYGSSSVGTYGFKLVIYYDDGQTITYEYSTTATTETTFYEKTYTDIGILARITKIELQGKSSSTSYTATGHLVVNYVEWYPK